MSIIFLRGTPYDGLCITRGKPAAVENKGNIVDKILLTAASGHVKMLRMDSAKDKAIALKIKGLTYAEIGKVLGFSRQRAQQLVSPPKEVFRFVRKRAKHKCQDCGIELLSGHVHHVDSTEDYNDIDNLRYLCSACHTRAHKVGALCECSRCNHAWKASTTETPKACPRCKRYDWEESTIISSAQVADSKAAD